MLKIRARIISYNTNNKKNKKCHNFNSIIVDIMQINANLYLLKSKIRNINNLNKDRKN